MKKLVLYTSLIALVVSGCATVQSIIKSTFPYTTTVNILAGAKADATQSVSSTASSIDQVFGNTSGTDYIKDVRVVSVKLDASNPQNQSLGIFKSVKVFLRSSSGAEVMIASRNDIMANIGNNLVLDVDNSRFVDEYIKGNDLRIRMEYVLRNNLTSDVSVRAAINFSSTPNTK